MTKPVGLEFLEALARSTGGCDARNERFIFCGFAGDPYNAETRNWRPRAWKPGDDLPINPARTNGYVAVSTFGRAPDGTWRRRSDLFRSGRALMVDDVNTKVPRAKVQGVKPSAIVETSAGNEQWWYFLGEPARDAEMFGSLIRAFIDQRLLSPDPGMNGVNRVGRLPGFVNGKKSNKNFRVQLLALDANRLYTCAELSRAFSLQPRAPKTQPVAPSEARARSDVFINLFALFNEWGIVKKPEGNVAGWYEIECPWRDLHTARAGTGAALREPAPENEWVGAFQCHHGHCIDRTWRDLEEWAVEQINEKLEAAAL